MTSFWAGLGGKLADRWLAVALPSLLFWLAGAVAWLAGSGGRERLAAILGDLDRAGTGTALIAVALALLVVAGSAAVVERLTLPVVRLLEGYWPGWLRGLRDRAVRWRGARIARDEARYQELERASDDDAGSVDELIALDERLRRVPAAGGRMPTRLGDVLRAAEALPQAKYGLDAVHCWPRLWLVLPEPVQRELLGARRTLDAAVTGLTWAVLAAVWTPVAWWVLPIAVAAVVVVHRWWLLPSAQVYGDLVEASFDVYRTALYDALRWPLPDNPRAEHELGLRLTQYLWRGSRDDIPQFRPPV
jgi:hypothetical protein